jgi:hypothetical protein
MPMVYNSTFVRALVMAVQAGLLLWLVTADDKSNVYWMILFPGAILVPWVILMGMERISPRALALWALILAVVLGLFAWYGIWRGEMQLLLPLVLLFSTFVANALFTAMMEEACVFPSYPRVFETAWRQWHQLGLSFIFLIVFWIVLLLGVALFNLIGLSFLKTLILQPHFAVPVSALAFALALQVNAAHPTLVEGARSLVLMLLALLLPLLVSVLALFLVMLPFRLDAFWEKAGSGLLISASIGLVILINSVWKDGRKPAAAWLRVILVLAVVELVAFTGFAIYGVSVRVAQHGWTESRVYAAALVLLLTIYTAGYAAGRIPRTNYFAAVVMLGLTVALFSPIADPARIMVASQSARLVNADPKQATEIRSSITRDGARWGRNFTGP